MSNYKKVEQQTADLLNEIGYNVQLHDHQNSVYDIHGTDPAGVKVFIEVKNRGKKYDTWYIETAKIKNIKYEASQTEGFVKLLYCCVSGGNVFSFYDIDKIVATHEPFKRNLPEHSAFKSRMFIEKEIYEFKADTHIFEINNK